MTSPPYNIGKEYEKRTSVKEYLRQQREIIDLIYPRLKVGGSLCWQVGNYVENGSIEPLDIMFHPLFKRKGLTLRNRIIWKFGHGLHGKKRFSGRYEVILWYTKGDSYTFNLDSVRVESKYPGKRHYKGPKEGQLSSNPLGKNPEDVWLELEEDVWDIPNVKANHIEKRGHPCQFPVGLVERLVLALTNPGDLVFDPYCGAGSAGVAALVTKRRFWGCEIEPDYVELSEDWLQQSMNGGAKYRPHDKPLYDHKQSPLSIKPSC